MERTDKQEKPIDLKKAVSFLEEILPEAGEILKGYFKNRNYSLR